MLLSIARDSCPEIEDRFMAGKQVEIDTNFKPQTCAMRTYVGGGDDDRISQLPDDILVRILSSFSLKEAGRTSVLSPRWINLWKHIPSLDFDAHSPLLKPHTDPQRFKKERSRYVKWVNSVLQSHESPTLKLFRLRFPLDKSNKNSITQWLQFAFSRHVQSLELDFPIDDNLPNYYPFPEGLLRSFDFKSLRALSFKKVNVSSRAIEFFLHNCPLLEQLIVHYPGKISKLEVCGPSLALKHFEIGFCPSLESLKVSAPSLTSLKLTSCLEGVLLENVPMLVDLSVICHDTSIHQKRLLSQLSCCISQLETLALSFIKVGHKSDELCKFPEMPKLKKLVIGYGSRDEDTLGRFVSLTQSSPYLQEFVLKNMWPFCQEKHKVVDVAAGILPLRHEHLKVFEFCDYRGRPSDDAVVRYILESCVVLEKIIIGPSSTYVPGGLDVEHLIPELSRRHVELVVL